MSCFYPQDGADVPSWSANKLHPAAAGWSLLADQDWTSAAQNHPVSISTSFQGVSGTCVENKQQHNTTSDRLNSSDCLHSQDDWWFVMLATQKETCGCQCFHSLKDKFERKGWKTLLKNYNYNQKTFNNQRRAFRRRRKSEAKGLRGLESLYKETK